MKRILQPEVEREGEREDAVSAPSRPHSNSSVAARAAAVRARRALQRKESGAGGSDSLATAASGVEGPPVSFPHKERIEASFGRSIPASAHVGEGATDACSDLSAEAYTLGDRVAFASAMPSLHTAAHEAAHALDQAEGVQPKGGIGVPGDRHEQAADAVADRVVAGESAADLIGKGGGAGASAAPALQRKGLETAGFDYKQGGTFTSGYSAKKQIAPGSGPRLHIAPDEVPAMLQNLLDHEESKEILKGHAEGVSERVNYWRKTLPDFTGSPTDIKIMGLLPQVYAKAAKAKSGRTTRPQNPVDVVSLVAPREPASQATWKAWLIEHKAEKQKVLALLMPKVNLITEGDSGNVANIEDPKSEYKSPLAAAILELQRDAVHRDYATSLAKALWASGSVKADDKFRQKDGWFSDLGFAVYYADISSRLKSFDGMVKKPKGAIKAAASRMTSHYLEKWVADKKKTGPGDAKIRTAFYEAVKDLVRRTKSGKIAVAFQEAMTDVMVANVDDPRIRAEIPDVHGQIRDILKQAGAPEKDVDESRDAAWDVTNEKTKLMDKDIHKNSVEVQYIKLYIAIRQAVRTVGEAWIEEKTRRLRGQLANIAHARTWVERETNVAWSLATGPAMACPTVLVGAIADIFLEMEQAKVKRQLRAYEAHLRHILDQQMSSRLGNIAAMAESEFAKIDAGKAQQISSGLKFKSIGDIEKIFSQQLLTALK